MATMAGLSYLLFIEQFMHGSLVSRTDGRTDRQTDGYIIAYGALHYVARPQKHFPYALQVRDGVWNEYLLYSLINVDHCE